MCFCKMHLLNTHFYRPHEQIAYKCINVIRCIENMNHITNKITCNVVFIDLGNIDG